MRSSPLLMNSPDDVGRRLSRLTAKPHDPKDEMWLQELLYVHPELLPVQAFDDDCAPPIPIGREIRTDRGPIDNLYVSPEGRLTIVETKLWKNPEKHRTVVAQIVDYAKELAAWDYDQLCGEVLASSRRRGETQNASLEQKVGPALFAAEVELHQFQDAVAACLADARFLLLIVGDRISPNITLLSKAIRGAPGLRFTLGLVEMQLYEMNAGSDWPVVVVPQVVGRTVEKTRGVVKVSYTENKPRVEVAEDAEDSEVSGTASLDRASFLHRLPKDLVQPYGDGIDSWVTMGGTVRFAAETMFMEWVLGGASQKIVRCRENMISVIRREFVQPWGGSDAVFEQYLDDLAMAPVVADRARSGKLWVSYDKLSGDDLRLLFGAARGLVQRIKSEA